MSILYREAIHNDEEALFILAANLATRRASEFYNAIGYEESATYFKKKLQ